MSDPQQERIEVGGWAGRDRALGRVGAIRRSRVGDGEVTAVDDRRARPPRSRKSVSASGPRPTGASGRPRGSPRGACRTSRECLGGFEARRNASLPSCQANTPFSPFRWVAICGHERRLALHQIGVRARIALSSPRHVGELGVPVIGEQHTIACILRSRTRDHRREPLEHLLGVLGDLRLEHAPTDEDPHQRTAGLRERLEVRAQIALVPLLGAPAPRSRADTATRPPRRAGCAQDPWQVAAGAGFAAGRDRLGRGSSAIGAGAQAP